jgi:hypothetical protein
LNLNKITNGEMRKWRKIIVTYSSVRWLLLLSDADTMVVRRRLSFTCVTRTSSNVAQGVPKVGSRTAGGDDAPESAWSDL